MTKEEFLTINPDDVMLIDIREPGELRTLPLLPRAVNIPMRELVIQANEGVLPKEKLIVTICRSGARCYPVNEILHNLGYRVDLIDGGVIGW